MSIAYYFKTGKKSGTRYHVFDTKKAWERGLKKAKKEGKKVTIPK